MSTPEEKTDDSQYDEFLADRLRAATEKWLMLPRWMRVWKPPQEVNRSVECARRVRQIERGILKPENRGGKNG